MFCVACHQVVMETKGVVGDVRGHLNKFAFDCPKCGATASFGQFEADAMMGHFEDRAQWLRCARVAVERGLVYVDAALDPEAKAAVG